MGADGIDGMRSAPRHHDLIGGGMAKKMTDEDRAKLDARTKELLELALDGKPDAIEAMLEEKEFHELTAHGALDDAAEQMARFRELAAKSKNPSDRLLTLILASVLARAEDTACTFALAGARRRAMEKRIDELEREAIRYAGTHEQSKAYGQNEAVTYKNGLWIARRATCDRPGESDAWKLAARGAKQ